MKDKDDVKQVKAVRFPADLWKSIIAAARDEHMSVSEFVRLAISSFLEDRARFQ
jgi:hypothetical protein